MSKRPFQPRRDDVREDELAAFDRVIERQTSYDYARPAGEEAGMYFGALLQAPIVADHMSELGVYYRTRGGVEGSFSHKQREWTCMVVGKDILLDIMLGHMLDAVAVGVRPEAIEALYEGRDWDLDRDELQLATFVRQVMNGTVTQASYDALEEVVGVRGLVEWMAYIAHLSATTRLKGLNPDRSYISPKLDDPGRAEQATETAAFDTRDMRRKVEERLQSVIGGTAKLPSGPRIPTKE